MTVTVDWYDGPRSALRPLFELADDSASELDGYLELGRVLVAREGALVLGHAQLVPSTRGGDVELKNMAVAAERRRSGVGRALVEFAVGRCTDEGWSRMVVATGAADIGNLRFYQRVGFRLLSVERDAFTPETGYPDPIVVDGVPLRDRVWLSRELRSDAGAATFPALRQTVLDTPAARELAEFYRRLLGWQYRAGDEMPSDGDPDPAGADWLVLVAPDGTARLAFQQVAVLPAVTWPEGPVAQQAHLDLVVPSTAALDEQHARVLSLGATLLEDRSHDPDEPLRVYADPAGHPFCVFVG